MSDTHETAKALLSRCDATAAMPARRPERTANMIEEHRELREALRAHLQYQDGFRVVHLQVLSMVYELLGTISAASNGRANWVTELPTGTAPAFRRALNKLLAFVRGESAR